MTVSPACRTFVETRSILLQQLAQKRLEPFGRTLIFIVSPAILIKIVETGLMIRTANAQMEFALNPFFHAGMASTVRMLMLQSAGIKYAHLVQAHHLGLIYQQEFLCFA